MTTVVLVLLAWTLLSVAVAVAVGSYLARGSR